MTRWSSAIAISVLLIHGSAQAQMTGTAADAEQLYEKAWEAMERNDYENACSLFERSFAISRATGPLQGLATCHERRGALSRALGLWRQAEQNLAPDASSLIDVRAAIFRLERRVPLLTLSLVEGSPLGAVIELDGEPVAADGRPREVDPGAHELTVNAKDRAPTMTKVKLGEGERKTLVLSTGATIAVERAPEPGFRLGPIRIAGIAAGSVGVAAAIAAGVTGGLMIAAESDIDAGCPGEGRSNCDASALAAKDRADGLAPWNVAMWVGAVAGVGAGIPLMIVGDGDAHDAPPPAQVTLGPGFVSISASF